MSQELTKPLTDNEQGFIENLLLGMTPTQAARTIGLGSPKQRAYEMMQKPHIQTALQQARRKVAAKAKITKNKVVDIVTRAVDIAELQGDPRSMITGAGELSKMFGFYEPEKKEVTLSADVAEKHRQLRELSDEDLLTLAGDEVYVDFIEAEYEVLPDGSSSDAD